MAIGDHFPQNTRLEAVRRGIHPGSVLYLYSARIEASITICTFGMKTDTKSSSTQIDLSKNL